jgi:hypothetical protein
VAIFFAHVIDGAECDIHPIRCRHFRGLIQMKDTSYVTESQPRSEDVKTDMFLYIHRHNISTLFEKRKQTQKALLNLWPSTTAWVGTEFKNLYSVLSRDYSYSVLRIILHVAHIIPIPGLLATDGALQATAQLCPHIGNLCSYTERFFTHMHWKILRIPALKDSTHTCMAMHALSTHALPTTKIKSQTAPKEHSQDYLPGSCHK